MYPDTEEFDSIIIGSGAGGLTTAICLAKAGQKVLVLEQHYVPGGWCHSFHIKGQRFSPGLHYIGLADTGQSTSELFEGLGVANDLVFFRMNKDAYEHCRIENERFNLPAGIDALYESLVQKFPLEKKSLKKYLKLVQNVSRQIQLIPKMNGFWDNITIPFRTRHMGKYGLFGLKRVLDWHINDTMLKAILSVQCGDHGLPPNKASFPLHCAVMDHYLDGAYYPMGGGSGLVKAMTNALKRNKGEIRVKQKVNKIIIKEHQAVGVELESGKQIFAKRVISNADPSTTYLKMVGSEHLSPRLVKKLTKTKYSVSSLILFITIDMDVKIAGLDTGNLWILKDRNIDEIYNDLINNDVLSGDEFPAIFLSCTTLKDPASYNGRHHTLEAVTFIDYNSFAEFNHPGDYHGEAYSRYKKIIIEKYLNTLEKILPGIRENIIQVELGTPKTNEHYINSTNGCVYGTEKTFRQIGPFAFSNKSEIKNLYLCGASTLSHGVSGASYSGINAAAKILNCKASDLLKPDKNQKLRVYDAEDSTTWPDWLHQKIADKKRRFSETKKENNFVPVENIIS